MNKRKGASRVSNANGFYLRAIAGPVISAQFRATEFRLETLGDKKDERIKERMK